MNRRKVLTALGGITIGGGALFGTGAFSTVQAERTVSVDTADDSKANVQFTVDSSSSAALSSSGGETISIDGNNLNLNGITRIDTALILTVSSSASGTYDIDVYESSSTSNSITTTSPVKDSSGDTMQLIFNSVSGTGSGGGSGGATGVESGESVKYDILFNTKDTTSTGSLSDPYNGSIVVKAESV